MEIADPTSPNYGKHWTSEQVIKAFKPSGEALGAVRKWLVSGGISPSSISVSENQGWFAFHATVKQMERLLHTKYREYEHLQTGGLIPACERYHVPASVQHHIDYLTPGIRLMAPGSKKGGKSLQKRQWSGERAMYSTPSTRKHRESGRSLASLARSTMHRSNLSNCNWEISPACIAALYDIPPAPEHADPCNSMGIYETSVEYWDQQDLESFFTNFTKIANGTHTTEQHVDGAKAKTSNMSLAGDEIIMDLDLAYPIIYPQTITVWDVNDLQYQSNHSTMDIFNTFLDAIDGSYCTSTAFGETGNLPGLDPSYPDPRPYGYNGTLQCGVFKSTNVISISYGGQEAQVPIAYQKRQCMEYLKLGLQGVSVLFASGDSGIGDYPGKYGSSGPTGCLGPGRNVFNPTFPNTCPYITNVGATKVFPDSTVYEPERATWEVAGQSLPYNARSGGGFSNIYPAPDYQKYALETFFAEHSPRLPSYSTLSPNAFNSAHVNVTALAGNSSVVYNRIGRGVPDVAANGANTAIWINGALQGSGGSSASTVIFAAIINRINEERLAVGKGPVGFLNPSLYKHPEILNDITKGNNSACLGQGFEAVEGWDPVTGLGTPNYPKMLELFLSLP